MDITSGSAAPFALSPSISASPAAASAADSWTRSWPPRRSAWMSAKRD